jgi:EAL domain-containing protein (putative c-di-GMP-specific phosphodiesterase class I)
VRNKLHGEVLVRILDHDGSLIGPDAFIPAAECYSLMGAIDRWVVKKTLETLGQDIDYVQNRMSTCSINLSGQSISDDRFMSALAKMIEDMDILPELLCFEITETAVISNLSSATRLIDTLRDIGVDYAQGYGVAKPLPLEDALYGRQQKPALKLVSAK